MSDSNNEQQKSLVANSNNTNTNQGDGQPAQTPAPLVIGGPMKCFIHFDKNGDNFTTDNYDVWNKHCHDFGHTLSGIRKCEDCDNLLVFHNYPYHDVTAKGSTLVIRCEDCETKLETQKQNNKKKGLLKTVGKYKASESTDNK